METEDAEGEIDLVALSQPLDAAIDEHNFSGVIRLRHGNVIIYERAAGFADRANRLPNTLDTRFGIASGTKFLTALAIGRLIESGRLTLDTRLVDVIDLGFAQYDPGITIRHLLTHTSGIPDYYDEEKVKDPNGFTVSVPWCELRGPRDYLAVFPDEPMKFAPGKRFSYSNGGFIVLGIVIEELSGTTYQRFVETEILGPAGMDRSGFFAMNRLPEQTALGYVQEQDGWRTNVFDLPIVGASDGGVFTTLGDLTKLWDAFWGNRILSHELVNAFTKPFVRAESEGEYIHYGHGIWVYEDGGRSREVYIEGYDAGVSFRSGTNLTKAFEYAVISNTASGAWPVLEVIDTALRP